jgi:SpoIID/LytB domain protein
MRRFGLFLIFGLSLLFAAEIRDGTLYLEINLAASPELVFEGTAFDLSEDDRLFQNSYSGKVRISVVSPESDNRYGLIERVESTAGYVESEAVSHSYFAWEDEKLLIKHEHWFFLPDSFRDLAQAQAYASSLNYPYSRIQSIPIVNSTLLVIDASGESAYYESPLKLSSQGQIWLNGLPYEGEFVLKIRNGKLVLNQLLPLEEYIAGVVPNEIGNNSPPEALKAQAVAARSHAVSLLLYNRHTKDGYDLCSSTHCQVYKGKHLRNAQIVDAVMQTAGEIMTVAGKVADATYHSSCGGKTDSSQAIWKGAYVPHLSGSTCIPEADEYDLSTQRGASSWLNSKPDASGMSSWEQATMSWERTVSKAQVAKNIGLNSIRSIEILERGRSGRILKLRFIGDRTIVLDGEYKIRQAFGKLPSSFFVFKAAPGKTLFQPGSAITIKGRGSGHGVGMCQVGALRQARTGLDYTQILQTYYPETEINTDWIDDERP